jgi:hypothetical protein
MSYHTSSRLQRAVAACTVTAVVGMLGVASARLSAQWVHYPTSGIPRTKDGTPNLKAPAPRTRDGHPDLSGIWYAADATSAVDVSQMPPDLLVETLKAQRAPSAPGPATDDPCLKGCISQEDFGVDGVNIGRSLPDKTLPYQPWARQAVLQHMIANAKDDPHSRCAPPSYPRAFSLPQHWKIVQTPRLMVLLHEFNASYRQIFLDGRPLPVDPQPAWNGYSTGHWERDTLVVETAGFRDGIWLDLVGSPLTEAAHVTERFRRVNFGLLEIQVTVNDPKAYTKPWKVTLHGRLEPDTELLDDICVEGVYLLGDGQEKTP